MDALAAAEKIDPGFAWIYDYRGNIYLLTNRFADAVSEYRRALAIDPTLEPARQDLGKAERGLAGGRR
jgi:tetratricopeptide (TPR) repeat protein